MAIGNVQFTPPLTRASFEAKSGAGSIYNKYPINTKYTFTKTNMYTTTSMSTRTQRRNPPGYVNALIKNVRLGVSIPLTLAPKTISESISANFTQQAIVGKSQPVIAYTDTGARQLSISLEVSDEILPYGFNDITSYVRALKQLVYPSYSGDRVLAPECEVYIANVSMIGVCQSINVSWDGRYGSNKIVKASVDMTFMETKSLVNGAVSI